jgi:hypothetical protein
MQQVDINVFIHNLSPFSRIVTTSTVKRGGDKICQGGVRVFL